MGGHSGGCLQVSILELSKLQRVSEEFYLSENVVSQTFSLFCRMKSKMEGIITLVLEHYYPYRVHFLETGNQSHKKRFDVESS